MAALAEIDPQAVLDRLAVAEDDGMMQQVILLGLFETPNPVAGRAAASVRRVGMGQSDALPLVLLAKHAEILTAVDLDALATLAAGGTRLSESLRTQAAWLLAKHAQCVGETLARLFDDAASPRPPS